MGNGLYIGKDRQINKVFLGYPNKKIQEELEIRRGEKHRVRVFAVPEKWGTVGGYCIIKDGGKVNVWAEPNRFYEFEKWSDGDVNPNRKIFVDRDITLYAIFKKDTGTIYFNDK